MSDHSDPKSANNASSHREDPSSLNESGYSQDELQGYDPLEDDLFSHSDTVTFSDTQDASGRSKWLIILGGFLVAVAVILGLKMLAGSGDEPVEAATQQPVAAVNPASATAEDQEDVTPLLSEELEVPMPTTEQEAKEQVDALTSEQELLDEQIAMYEDQLATSQKLTELKATQIAALEQQINTPN